MIQFKISAPGKVILYGEHAVVYGKTAVAASLNLRTTAEFTELSVNEVPEQVEILFPKVDLSLNVPIQEVQDFFFSDSFNCNEDYESLYNRVQQFVSTMNRPAFKQKLSLEAFFYLLIYIVYKERIDLKPFRVHLDSELSIGSGLGSSASFAVCLAGCFLHWSHLQQDIRENFNEFDLENISKYAFNCEKIMHGNPSGIDNAVCTYGSIVEYTKDLPMNLISGMPNMKILLVDTRVKRSTKMMVERLAELKRKYPMIIDPILESINSISKKGIQVINQIRELPIDEDASLLEEYKELMTLINLNQGLLSTMQVSHPSLDKICADAQKHTLAAKLTGAGGGGYAYILLMPDTQPKTVSTIALSLMEDGFYVTPTSLGCNGVAIHE